MTTPISSVSQGSELAKAIVRNFDTNGDGKLSTVEFGAFLTNLVAGIKTSNSSASASATTTSSSSNVQSPIGTVPSPPPVSSPIGIQPSPPLVSSPIGTVPTPQPVSPPIGTQPSPPLVSSPIGIEPLSPPVSSSPIDDSNQGFDFIGPFLTNMPTLPTPPGWEAEPNQPSGILGGSGSAGSGTPVHPPEVTPNSPTPVSPHVQSPIGIVPSPSLRTLARIS